MKADQLSLTYTRSNFTDTSLSCVFLDSELLLATTKDLDLQQVLLERKMGKCIDLLLRTGIMTLHLNNTKYETVDVTLQLIDGGGVFRLNGNTYGQDRQVVYKGAEESELAFRTAVKNLKMILKTLTTGVFARISCPSVTILEGNGTISRDCAVQVEVDGESLQSGFNFSLESARQVRSREAISRAMTGLPQVPDFGLLPNQIFQTLPSLTTDGKLSFRAAHWIHGSKTLPARCAS
eukprot:768650-Hanusia_phi.AAC.6